MGTIILILIIGITIALYVRWWIERSEDNYREQLRKERERKREEEQKNKPEPTRWDIKKVNGGTHSWIVNGRIDPKYIESLPDEEDSNTMEVRVINKDPF